MREGAWLEAFRGWTVDRLHFRERHGSGTDGQTVWFQIQRPTPKEQESNRRRRQPSHFTLVPIGRFIERFRHVMDDAASSANFREPRTQTMTFARSHARVHGVPLARLGQPFLDAMAEYLRLDDSGIAFGLWRCRRTWTAASPPADLAFRFDFLIEGRIDNALAVLPSGSAVTRPAVRRLADQLLPPEFLTVWVDDAGEPLIDGDRFAVFAAPYREGPKGVEGRDFNLNPDKWRAIEHLFPSGDWPARLHQARAVADRVLEHHLNASGRLAELVRQAHEEAATRRQPIPQPGGVPANRRTGDRAGTRAADDERLWVALIAGIERTGCPTRRARSRIRICRRSVHGPGCSHGGGVTMEHLPDLLTALATFPAGPLPKGPLAEPCLERLRIVLANVRERPTAVGRGDLAGLVGQVVWRAAATGQQGRVRVPASSPWPSSAHWQAAGVGVASHSGGTLLLEPGTPSAPAWLPTPHGPGLPLPDLFAETERRHRDDSPALAADPCWPAVLGQTFARFTSPGQRDALRAAAFAPPGSTLLVCLPTGSGKSLVGWGPAILGLPARGVTLVVVPTVALGMDQERQVRCLLEANRLAESVRPTGLARRPARG